VLFSIVIPTYQRPEALETCLCSFSLQDFPKTDFELIVSNNYPKNNIDALINHFRNIGLNITSIDEWRPGAHFARNSGVNAAKGKYILFTDDDCEADISLLSAYKAAIEKFKPIIAAGRIDISWDSIPPNWIISLEGSMGKIDLGSGNFWLRSGQVANGGNLLIQRDFFLSIGGMEPDQVGKFVFGSGDISLSLSANRFGYNVLWVGNARVWHHQKREVNAKLNDLLRRAFNNGMVMAYELQKQNAFLGIPRIMRVSARLTLTSANQFLKGILFFNLSSIARSLFILCRITGIYWFLFQK
jgi:glycosyltransferase involved in cell wall biosynthesis